MAQAQAVDTTVCDVLKDPASFNGKTVRIKGTVVAGFDSFVVAGASCGQKNDGIWLAYPEGTKARSGPAAMLQLQPAKNFAGTVTPVNRAAVTLDKNKDFKQFDQLLSTPAKAGASCLGCIRHTATATLVGRLDGTQPEIRREGGKIVSIRGFGNLNAYSARLVLQSVSEVTAQEVDYSKPAAGTASGVSLASLFNTGTALKDQPRRAVEAFGKEGDDNGVEVGAVTNEAAPALEAEAIQSSPDGVRYNCALAFDRLKGDAMGRAMSHMGAHIADLRAPEANTETAPAYVLEFRAWMVTLVSAISQGQKQLQLPGGYVVYDASWPQSALGDNTEHAVGGYLDTVVHLNH